MWGEKSLYGRKYMGMERATFLVDAKGVIAQAWRKVKVPGHVEAVLDAAKTLMKEAIRQAFRSAVNLAVVFLAAGLIGKPQPGEMPAEELARCASGTVRR